MAPPVWRRERPFQAKCANHTPRNAASVIIAIPPAPVEVKAESLVDVEEVKEENLEEVVKFNNAWPPIPTRDSRQKFEDDAENDAGNVIAAITAAPVTPRRRGRLPGSRNSPRMPLIPPPSGPDFGHLCVKTLRMRRK